VSAHSQPVDHRLSPDLDAVVSGSQYEVEFLCLTEIDDQGQGAFTAVFETNDADAAIAGLEERFLAGEAATSAPLRASRSPRTPRSVKAIFAGRAIVARAADEPGGERERRDHRGARADR
jgi:hypothetical protein